MVKLGILYTTVGLTLLYENIHFYVRKLLSQLYKIGCYLGHFVMK
jgi:hypothetical protein